MKFDQFCPTAEENVSVLAVRVLKTASDSGVVSTNDDFIHVKNLVRNYLVRTFFC